MALKTIQNNQTAQTIGKKIKDDQNRFQGSKQWKSYLQSKMKNWRLDEER